MKGVKTKSKVSYTEIILSARHCTHVFLSNSHNNPARLVLFSPITDKKIEAQKVAQILRARKSQI